MFRIKTPDCDVSFRALKKPKKPKETSSKKSKDEEDPLALKPDDESVALITKKKRKKRAKAAPGYGPAPDNKVYTCQYCDFSGKKKEWLSHLKKEHADKSLVRFTSFTLICISNLCLLFRSFVP